jgi:hypothetical protein
MRAIYSASGESRGNRRLVLVPWRRNKVAECARALYLDGTSVAPGAIVSLLLASHSKPWAPTSGIKFGPRNRTIATMTGRKPGTIPTRTICSQSLHVGLCTRLHISDLIGEN